MRWKTTLSGLLAFFLLVALSSASLVMPGCGSCNESETLPEGNGLADSPSKESDGTGDLTAENWDRFLESEAALSKSTDDQAALRMSEMARDYMDEEDPYHTSGKLPEPEIGYFEVDFDGRNTTSYYLYWLPQGWEQLGLKGAILYSQGHGAREPVGFAKLQEYAVERNMAIFMPQLWIEGEAPAGYEQYKKSPRDELNGLPDGFHILAEDEYMFSNSLIGAYGVDSFYVYGFSISGAIVMQVTAYDRYGSNAIDLTVVSGGGMGTDHHFLDEMQALGLEDFFSGKNFFFFGEIRDGTNRQQRSLEQTADIIVENGGNLVMEEYREVPHGGLLNQLPELMNQSLEIYERIAGERVE